jgi:TATA-box binding protein (TBP) (component of TFIID and TFIIIB)
MKSKYDSDYMYRTGKYTVTGKKMLRMLKRKANKFLNKIYPINIQDE